MREFDYTFSDGLKVGLRPYKTPRNIEAFISLKNARVGKYGLIPLEEIEDIFPQPRPETYPNVNQDWPFPQYFHGQQVDLLGLRKTFYEVRSDGTLTPVVIDIDNVQTDDLWDVGDFGKYQLVTKDGNFLLEKAGDTGFWNKTDTSHASIPMAKTVENFKGQALVGNISFASWSEADENYIAWSKIGSVSFVNDRMNIAGYRPMHFNGPVYKLKRLGDYIVVYGLNGIGILYPVSVPAPTYGYDSLANFGIASKGAVGGDENVHCFIGKDGNLYKVMKKGKSFEVGQLGYKEKVSLMSSDSVVSYVPGGESDGEGDFYISDSDIGYVLTSQGLTATHQKVTAVSKLDGVTKGFYESDGDTEFLGVTDIIDFGFRGQKTIYTFEVGCSGSGTYSIGLDWRMDTNAAFQTTQYVALNNQGIATLICAGAEFRLRLKYTNPADIDVSYIKIRYKSNDKRAMRGYYRAPNNERR